MASHGSSQSGSSTAHSPLNFATNPPQCPSAMPRITLPGNRTSLAMHPFAA
jgi:hypothetical protein